ncbi:putative leader peptide [Streptomyces sp. NPDC002156]
MPLPAPLTRRRAVDLVRVAAALCPKTGCSHAF